MKKKESLEEKYPLETNENYLWDLRIDHMNDEEVRFRFKRMVKRHQEVKELVLVGVIIAFIFGSAVISIVITPYLTEEVVQTDFMRSFFEDVCDFHEYGSLIKAETENMPHTIVIYCENGTILYDGGE